MGGVGQQKDEWQQVSSSGINYDLFQVAFRRHLQEIIPDVEAVAFNFGSGNFQQAAQYLDLFPEPWRNTRTWAFTSMAGRPWPASDQTDGEKRCRPLSAIMDGLRAKVREPARGHHHRGRPGAGAPHYGDQAGDVGWLNTVEPLTQDELLEVAGVVQRRPHPHARPSRRVPVRGRLDGGLEIVPADR